DRAPHRLPGTRLPRSNSATSAGNRCGLSPCAGEDTSLWRRTAARMGRGSRARFPARRPAGALPVTRSLEADLLGADLKEGDMSRHFIDWIDCLRCSADKLWKVTRGHGLLATAVVAAAATLWPTSDSHAQVSPLKQITFLTNYVYNGRHAPFFVGLEKGF